LDKIFNRSDPEYDPVERDEEANRMREHVIKEIDVNKDGLIGYDEFMEATKRKEYQENEEWNVKPTSPPNNFNF
jgi:nucleobindin